MMIPVLLSGGTGSRLWPLSRNDYPKQLLALVDPQRSMLQSTVARLSGLTDLGTITVVCNEAHRFLIADQLQQIEVQQSNIILEPAGRNTAPAIAVAAFHAMSAASAEDILLVMPADHVIADVAGFQDAVGIARQQAEGDQMVTFGIIPQYAESGYGYIHAGASISTGVFRVDSFHEKPEQQLAKVYLAAGDYYWNSGIFVFKAGVYLEQLRHYRADIFAACEAAYEGHVKDLDFMRLDAAAFLRSPMESIDYALMEQTDQAIVIPLDVGWSDIGSWSELHRIATKDSAGNAQHGNVLLHDTRNSFVYATDQLVATVGVDDLVIVQADDAVMVVAKDKAQDIKQLIASMQQRGDPQLEHHHKVYRPWGWYNTVAHGDCFQVKHIQVKPGARLSVQMHHHRSEHWVVVSGTAEVLLGEERLLLSANGSICIPVGSKHSLYNPSVSEPLEIIEVQSGTYLGEDDIVRFEDDYGRVASTATPEK